MFCPLCNTDDHVIIDLQTRERSHFCRMVKTRIYWRGSIFSIKPLLIPVVGGGDAA